MAMHEVRVILNLFKKCKDCTLFLPVKVTSKLCIIPVDTFKYEEDIFSARSFGAMRGGTHYNICFVAIARKHDDMLS